MAVNKVIYNVGGEEIVDQSGSVTIYGIDGTSMKVNKVEYGNQTLIDITDTTAEEAQVLSGYVIHKADGSVVTGTAETTLESSGGSVDDDTLVVGGMAVPYDWHGEEAEFVSEIYAPHEVALADTLFNGWTPSTTAKAIQTAANAGTFSADMAQYEYMLKWLCEADLVYASDATTKARTERMSAVICQLLIRRPNSLANIQADNFAGNACVTSRTSALMEYYNASGSHTYTWAASYGIYPSATAATFASSTNTSTTVTVKTPAWNARCSTTYFSTSNAGKVDQTNSKFRMKCDLYRFKVGSPEKHITEELVDLFNTPLSV